MAEALVGGAFLSATLQVLFDRLAHREVLDYLRGKKFNHGLLKRLKIMLLSVNSVLNDAEEKQITETAVKEWLDELEDAAYDADDLLDEIATDALQYKLEAESRTGTSSKVSNMDLISPNSYVSGMESRLKEILEQLEFIAHQKDLLGLKVKEGVGEKPIPRSQTTSLVEESEVFGRDSDKNAIIKLLLADDEGSNNKVSVIPIVGMGGVGKTTLAQLVYNDEKVEKHFELKSWVCVSQEFNIYEVTKTVLAAATSPHSYDSTNLDLLQKRLKEKLVEKKFLIVLDDVWNENYNDWKDMSIPFNHGARGSKIIVTTRNENVARIIRTVPIHYHLECLNDEDCWKLFAKHAFDNLQDSSVCQVLETIGKRIVKKCNGLPLAAKTFGGLLRSKEDVGEWVRIEKSEIWDFSYKESKILPVLMSSYHYLPSYLKRCFAFCSIFPKYYKFKQQNLVLLWMAENLLQQPKTNKRSMEEVGDEYFNELVSMSFFKRSSAEEHWFFMHDLVYDLAKYVSREYSFTLESGKSEDIITMKVRHLAFAWYVPLTRLDSISGATRLRTFLPLQDLLPVVSNEVVNEVIKKLRCLRVLKLSGCGNLNQLHRSIGDLKHLRYLDVSSTPIKRLPESVSMLYNLQMLNLSNCYNLIQLPKNMHHLINLRHLNVRGCNKLKQMPRHINKLKSLQRLSTFIVGKDKGAKIGELMDLSDLHGDLSLTNLQNVGSDEDASEANLKEKQYLEELKLYWNGDTNDSKHGKNVLDKLLPHTNLKRIYIHGYGGTVFPKWLEDGSFCNILFLLLSDCKFCTCLPSLGQLSSLKKLEIEGLDRVVSVGAELYGMNGTSCMKKAFPSLESLRFSKMSNWEEWCSSNDIEDGDVFPKLQELIILDCDRLISIDLSHNLPSLTKLRIDGDEVVVSSLPRTPTLRQLMLGGRCEKLELQELPQTMETIAIGNRCSRAGPNCLEILNCEKVEFPLMHHSLRRSSIQEVYIVNSCGSLESFPLDFFPTLRHLSIEGCKNLVSLTVTKSDEQDATTILSLSTMSIQDCPSFICFPNGKLHAPSLTELRVMGCKKLKKLPEQMHNLLPSLECLFIHDCPELESFPEGGLPSNLALLGIAKCSKLIAQRKKWDLQKVQALVDFHILMHTDDSGAEGVESFPEEGLLPSTLTSLHIRGCASLNRLNIKGLQQLTSLQRLCISQQPQLSQSLPQLHTSFGPSRIGERSPALEEEFRNHVSHIPHIDIDSRLPHIDIDSRREFKPKSHIGRKHKEHST